MGWQKVLLGMACGLLIGVFLFFKIFPPESTRRAALHTAIHCFSFEESARGRCYDEYIPTLYPSRTISEILAIIRTLQHVDSAIAYCHELGHRLGEVAAAHNPKDFTALRAEEPPDALCGTGYTHGILRQVYKDERPVGDELRNLVDSMAQFCERRADGKERVFHEKVSCYHGLGHTFFYLVDESLERGMQLCDRAIPLREIASYRDMHARCLNAVAHMSFAIFLPPAIGGVREEDVPTQQEAEALCRSLSRDEFRSACARSSWALYFDDMVEGDGVNTLCAAQPTGYLVNQCYGKVLPGLAWKLRYDRGTYRAICERVDSRYTSMCYASDAIEYISNAGVPGVRFAANLCRQAEPEFVATCLTALAQKSWWYTSADSTDRKHYCAALPVQYRGACTEARPQE